MLGEDNNAKDTILLLFAAGSVNIFSTTLPIQITKDFIFTQTLRVKIQECTISTDDLCL